MVSLGNDGQFVNLKTKAVSDKRDLSFSEPQKVGIQVSPTSHPGSPVE